MSLSRVSSRDGEELPVLVVRPTKTEAVGVAKQPIGTGHQARDNTIVSNTMALNKKKRSASRDAEEFRYNQHIEMFNDGEMQSCVVPVTVGTAPERRQWASGEHCPQSRWIVPAADVSYSELPCDQRTTAVIHSSAQGNENIPMPMEYYSGPWPSQHTQCNPRVGLPLGQSNFGSSSYHINSHHYQGMQNFAQFQVGYRFRDYAYSHCGRENPLDTYPRYYERFDTYVGEQRCNYPSFGQQPYSDYHYQPDGYPIGPDRVFNQIPGWFLSQSVDPTQASLEPQSSEQTSRALDDTDNQSDEIPVLYRYSLGQGNQFASAPKVPSATVASPGTGNVCSPNVLPSSKEKQCLQAQVKRELVDKNENTCCFNIATQVGDGGDAPSAAPVKVGKDCIKSELTTPRVWFGRHLVEKRPLFGIENVSVTGVPDSSVFCGPVTPETNDNSFPTPIIKSVCSLANLKSSKYVQKDSPKEILGVTKHVYGEGLGGNPERPVATKNRLVSSVLKQNAVKGRKSAIMKCNINAKKSIVRKVDENEVTQTNAKRAKRSAIMKCNILNAKTIVVRKVDENEVTQTNAKKETTCSPQLPRAGSTDFSAVGKLLEFVSQHNLKQNYKSTKPDTCQTSTIQECGQVTLNSSLIVTAKNKDELKRRLIKVVTGSNAKQDQVSRATGTKPETYTSASNPSTPSRLIWGKTVNSRFTIMNKNTDDLKGNLIDYLVHSNPQENQVSVSNERTQVIVNKETPSYKFIETKNTGELKSHALNNLKHNRDSEANKSELQTSVNFDPRLEHTYAIRQEGARAKGPNTSGSKKATVIKRTSLDTVNTARQESERSSQSNNATHPRHTTQQSLRSFPDVDDELAKTLQYEPKGQKVEDTAFGVIEADGDTRILTMEHCHEDPIPNHIKQRMKGCGKLDQVVSRLMAVRQGSADANAIDLTTQCSEANARLSGESNDINDHGLGTFVNEHGIIKSVDASPNHQHTPSSLCSQDEQVALQDLSSGVMVLAPKDSNKVPMKRSHSDAFGRTPSNSSKNANMTDGGLKIASRKVLTDFFLKQMNSPEQGKKIKQESADSGGQFASSVNDHKVERPTPQFDQKPKEQELGKDFAVVEDTPGVKLIIQGGTVTRVGATRPINTTTGTENTKLPVLNDREETNGSWQGTLNTSSSVSSMKVYINSSGEFSVNDQRVENITPQLDPEGRSDYLMLRSNDQMYMYFFPINGDKAYVLPLPKKDKKTADEAIKNADTLKNRFRPLSALDDGKEGLLASGHVQVIPKCKLVTEGFPIISTAIADDKENIVGKSLITNMTKGQYNALNEKNPSSTENELVGVRERGHTSKSQPGVANDGNVVAKTIMSSQIQAAKSDEQNQEATSIEICRATADDKCCLKPLWQSVSYTWSKSEKTFRETKDGPGDGVAKPLDCQPKIDIVPTGFRIRTNPDCTTCKKFLLKFAETESKKQSPRHSLMQGHVNMGGENPLPVKINSVQIRHGGNATTQEKPHNFAMKYKTAIEDDPEKSADQEKEKVPYSQLMSHPSTGVNHPMVVNEEITMDIDSDTITAEDWEHKIQWLRELLRCNEEEILMSRQNDSHVTARLMKDLDDY